MESVWLVGLGLVGWLVGLGCFFFVCLVGDSLGRKKKRLLDMEKCCFRFFGLEGSEGFQFLKVLGSTKDM